VVVAAVAVRLVAVVAGLACSGDAVAARGDGAVAVAAVAIEDVAVIARLAVRVLDDAVAAGVGRLARARADGVAHGRCAVGVVVAFLAIGVRARWLAAITVDRVAVVADLAGGDVAVSARGRGAVAVAAIAARLVAVVA